MDVGQMLARALAGDGGPWFMLGGGMLFLMLAAAAIFCALDRRRLLAERRSALAFGEAEFGTKFPDLGAMQSEIGKVLEGTRKIVAKNRELERTQSDLQRRLETTQGGSAALQINPGDAGIRSLAVPCLFAALSLVERELKDLAGDADLEAVNEVLRLGPALDDLAAGLDGVLQEQRPDHTEAIADMLGQGLKDRWLDHLVRSELVLSAYAPPGSPWSRLAQALRLLVTWMQTALLEGKKMELVSHPLLAVMSRRVRAERDDTGMLRRLGFVRRAVDQAILNSTNPGSIVIDCVELGTRDLLTGRIGQPRVTTYNSMNWQPGDRAKGR